MTDNHKTQGEWKSQLIMAINILFVPHNSREIRHAYKSKYNLNHESQVIILMITDNGKLNYLAVKRLSALFNGITSKHVGVFYCLNCLHSLRTENKFQNHKM